MAEALAMGLKESASWSSENHVRAITAPQQGHSLCMGSSLGSPHGTGTASQCTEGFRGVAWREAQWEESKDQASWLQILIIICPWQI